MEYEAQLEFLRRVARNMHLGCHVAARGPLPRLDRGLRELLEAAGEDLPPVPELLERMEENTIYRVRDPFLCRYLCLLLPGEGGMLVIGPYTTAEVTAPALAGLLERRGLSLTLLPHVSKYFSGVPILLEEDTLLAVMDAFGETLWGRDGCSVQWVELPEAEGSPPPRSGAERDHTLFDISVLEERYAVENQILYAVSQGQAHKAERLLTPFHWGNLERRQADLVRDMRNYMVSLNTLMRKAAEQGGVHPLYLDRLSGQFALEIEGLTGTEEVRPLLHEMIRKYCRLVREKSARAYSLPVQKVLVNIDYDLTADLSLRAQAARLQVNPSYLSALFKRETGQTLTEYVNRRRVEQAAILLRSTSRQIQTVAQQCGVPDVNYFTKLFKRQMGCTPVEYRREGERRGRAGK